MGKEDVEQYWFVKAGDSFKQVAMKSPCKSKSAHIYLLKDRLLGVL